jgi:hypothetical protein
MNLGTVLCAGLVSLGLVATAEAAYSIRADRFDVSGPGNTGGPYTDDFDDAGGAADGWTTLFGFWQDEPGNTFSRFDSPGFFAPDIFAPGVFQERTDVHSNAIPASKVGSTGDFSGIVKFETVLPGLDQTYFLVVNYFNTAAPSPLTNGFFVGITNYSPAYAALAGVPAGLNFGQFHWDYGPALEILNVTGLGFAPLGNPAPLDTIELGIQFSQGASQLNGSYRFDSGNAAIAPLAPVGITTIVSSGFWDIGVAQATVVPIPPSIVFIISGLATMLWRRNSLPVPDALPLFRSALLGLMGIRYARR